MEIQISEKTQTYLSRFYEPKITVYEFLKYFFAYLKRLNVEKIDSNLVKFLYAQKQISENSKRGDVLEEICFENNGVYYYSSDIEDALFLLHIGGLLSKPNPSYGILNLKYNENDITSVLDST